MICSQHYIWELTKEVWYQQHTLKTMLCTIKTHFLLTLSLCYRFLRILIGHDFMKNLPEKVSGKKHSLPCYGTSKDHDRYESPPCHPAIPPLLGQLACLVK